MEVRLPVLFDELASAVSAFRILESFKDQMKSFNAVIEIA